MKINQMHFSCKPSYKLVKKGASFLDDAELLSILLWNCDGNVLELANSILKNYNLNGFEREGFENLKKRFGRVIALKLISFCELSKRHNKLINKGHKKIITCSKDVYDIFVDELKDLKQEHFIVVCLDSKNRIIKSETVFVGTLNSSLIHPREIFKVAIKESANAVILVHNHPSGVCEPSIEDVNLTENLKRAGEVLGIRVLDHVVVGKDEFYSFEES